MAPLSYTFTPTPEDYADALRDFLLKQRMTWIVLLLSASMAAGGLLGVIAAGWQRFSFGIFLVLVFIVYVSFLWGVSPWLVRRRVRRNPRLTVETEWRLEEHALVVHNAHTDMTIEWKQFSHLVETPHHFLLVYAADDERYQAIPRRALGDGAEQQTFKQHIQQRLQSGSA